MIIPLGPHDRWCSASHHSRVPVWPSVDLLTGSRLKCIDQKSSDRFGMLANGKPFEVDEVEDQDVVGAILSAGASKITLNSQL